jgi:hypothetical protein
MYFANMYCYGDSNDIVGITGIRNCMGIVYIGSGSMYAIHIPYDKADVWRTAAQTFINFVSNNNGKAGSKGSLFGFVNGKNNSLTSKEHASALSAGEELAIIKKGLGSPKTVLCRIMKELGGQSGGDMADAAAIMVKRIQVTSKDPSGTAIFYKRDADVTWVSGGEPPTGQYKLFEGFRSAVIPSDLVGLWRRATTENCTFTTV